MGLRTVREVVEELSSDTLRNVPPLGCQGRRSQHLAALAIGDIQFSRVTQRPHGTLAIAGLESRNSQLHPATSIQGMQSNVLIERQRVLEWLSRTHLASVLMRAAIHGNTLRMSVPAHRGTGGCAKSV